MDEPDVRQLALGRLKTFRKIQDDLKSALAAVEKEQAEKEDIKRAFHLLCQLHPNESTDALWESAVYEITGTL